MKTNRLPWRQFDRIASYGRSNVNHYLCSFFETVVRGHKMIVVSDHFEICDGSPYTTNHKVWGRKIVVISLQGLARTQLPTNRNCDPKVVSLAGVSLTEVQWKGFFLGEPPS